MQTIAQQIDAAFRKAIQDAFGVDADPLVSPAQNEKFGDYQSNAAMGLSKVLAEKTGQKTNPRATAEQIIRKLDLGSMASEKPTIAGPGFINIKLSPDWLTAQVRDVASDPRLGVSKVTNPTKVVVDYSGPNIAKEMHVGHLRSTIIGDAIARVLEFRGDEVIRQNHLGDWGTQFGMLITWHWNAKEEWVPPDAEHDQSVTSRSKPEGKGALLFFHIDDLEAFYRNAKRAFDLFPEFADAARAAVVRLQKGDERELSAWRFIVDETRKHYQPLYERLNVSLRKEHEAGESSYNPLLPDVVKTLREKKLAVESEGATVVFIDGEDKSPLIIEKSGGGYLYGTTDLAAIRYRVDTLQADRIIYFTDARQAQHFSQVFRTADKASWTRNGEVKLEHAAFGAMLGEDGKPFKTRTGGTVKLKDLIDEAEERALKVVEAKNAELPLEQKKQIAHAVGIGAMKYADLSKDRVSDYVFSWDKMLAMDGNTAPYLQYAHARVCAIFRKAGVARAGFHIQSLSTIHEQSLAKHLLRFGEVIESLARDLKPHVLCTYLYDLATKFSSFYENCPVLQSEETVKQSRLALCDLTARTLATGLELLGIEHPEQM